MVGVLLQLANGFFGIYGWVTGAKWAIVSALCLVIILFLIGVISGKLNAGISINVGAVIAAFIFFDPVWHGIAILNAIIDGIEGVFNALLLLLGLLSHKHDKQSDYESYNEAP